VSTEQPTKGIPYSNLTAQEVAEFLRCSRATVDRMSRYDPDFPKPMKFGKALVRYRRDEIVAFLDRCRTNEPIEVRNPSRREKAGV
jgi:predicted DNA-binding transcriptional regulator AlpA